MHENVAEMVTTALNTKLHAKSVLVKYLVPEGKPESLEDNKRVADSLAAVDVAASLLNLFDALVRGGRLASTTAIVDLTYGLNRNLFWQQHAGYLMPLVNAGINAVSDQVDKPETLWEKLDYHNKYAWLEIFPAIVFCLHGPTKMREVSLELKKVIQGLVQ